VVSIKWIAFKCLECNEIDIFPARTADGRRCKECSGYLKPIGYVGVDLAKGKDKTGYPRSKKSSF